MIIDIHGHYTTEPAAFHAFRDKQVAGITDPSRRPQSEDLGLTDEQIGKFFVGPAYLPFGWMGCIDGWGGPHAGITGNC